MLLRRHVRSVAPLRHNCAKCRRTPLVGERLHELANGRHLCDLCLAALPEEKRGAVRSERVRASERQLAVVPKAA
jgi:hypothetical protein